MLINNLTDRTIFVLRSRGDGVSLPPGETEFPDALYTSDSAFNGSVDSLVAQERVSLTDAPTDPFDPAGAGFTLQATPDQTENLFEVYDGNGDLFLAVTPSHDLLVYSTEFFTGTMQAIGVDTDQYAELQPGGVLARALADQSWSLLNLEVASGNSAFSVEPDGSTYIHARDPAVIPLTVLAAAAQSADLLQVKDAGGALVFTIHPDGLIETNDAGLSINHNGGIDAGFLILQPLNAAYDVLAVQGKSGQTGKLVLVKDGAGATVFRIDADGSVHIKTGTTVQADL